jgi:meiotically up-regulated gene 157 (Mug157) protein/endo-beta-N-acetylglucosaminidase D
MYSKLYIGSQEYPGQIFKNGIPENQGSDGYNTVSYATFRLISLYLADKKKFGVLVGRKDKVELRVTDYNNLQKDELWRLVQTEWNIPGGAPQARFLVKHISTGKFLCVKVGEDIPSLSHYDEKSKERFIWSTNWGDRGIFFCDPKTKYYCSANSLEEPFNPDKTQFFDPNNKNNCDGFDATWPLNGGKPWIRVIDNGNNDYKLKMSTVINDFDLYSKTRKNDLENDFYVFYEYDDEITCPIPVTHGLSIGQMLSWKPNYHSKFNISKVPLKNRFIDTKTQTKPDQPQFPRVMASFNIPGSDQNIQCYSNPSVFTFENWEYPDFVIYSGNDQGWCPLELKNIKLDDPINPTLYNLLDGSRPGQGSRIYIPPKNIVESAHSHGCKILGAIFFQEIYYGGKWDWWVKFLETPDLTAKKLLEIAKYYGFDGYFINYETNSYTQTTCDGLCPTPGPYKFIGNNGQCEACSNPIGNPYGPANETKTFLPKDDEPEYGDYWCHYNPHGQGGPWNPGCNAAPCFRCIQKTIEGGEEQQKKSRDNLKTMFKSWQKYKIDMNYDAEMCMYESMAPDGNVAYYGGINSNNIDLWIDEEGKKVADSFFTMIPGGGIVPKGQTSTYIQTKESSDGCKEGKNNYGWPPNTGPNFTPGKCIQPGKNCVPEIKEGFDINIRSNKDLSYVNMGSVKSITQGQNGAQKIADNDNKNDVNDKNKKDAPLPQNCVCNEETCYESLSASLIQPLRSYDFYSTIDMSGFEDSLKPNDSRFRGGKSWDEALYCGSFHCVWNQSNAVTMPLTSLGLWSARIFNSKKDVKYNRDINNSLWVSLNHLCNNNDTTENVKGDIWKGVSHYVSEKSTYNSLPFYTNFSVGNGGNYFIDGNVQPNYGTWSDLIQSNLPTWKYWALQRDTGVLIDIDYLNVYEGGNSLKIYGTIGCFNTDFLLYKTKFDMNKDIELTITYKYDSLTRENSCVKFGYTTNLTFDKKVINSEILPWTNKWSQKVIKISSNNNDYINTLVLSNISSKDKNFICYIGEIKCRYINKENKDEIYVKKLEIENKFKNNYVIKWKGKADMFYIFNYNDEFIGRLRGNALDEDIYYFNIQNTDNDSFKVLPISLGGIKGVVNQIISSKNIFLTFLLIILTLIFYYITRDATVLILFLSSSILLFLNTTLFILYSLTILLVYLLKDAIGIDLNTYYSICVLLFIICILSYYVRSKKVNLISNEKLGYSIDSENLRKAKKDVIKEAKRISSEIKNEYLANVFYNTYTNPMLSYFKDNDEFIYVLTGNWGKDPPPPYSVTSMGGMWLRDACCQAHTYIDLAKRSEDVRKIIVRMLEQCYFFIIQDSYANAFNSVAEFGDTFVEGHNGYVLTKNYEPDSLIFVLWLAMELYKHTKETKQFSKNFYNILDKIVVQFTLEKHRLSYQTKFTNDNIKRTNPDPLTVQSVYRFEELPNGGIGSYVNDTGLTWTAFRASDDITIFGYHIPNNMFAFAVLTRVKKLLDKFRKKTNSYETMIELLSSIDSALVNWGIYNHPTYGKIYCYETDGLENETFKGDDKLTTFVLNGSIQPDCNKYFSKDIFNNDTGCNPFYPYHDKEVSKHRKSCNCDGFGCSTLDLYDPSNIKDNIFQGTRFLEVTINDIPVSFDQYDINGRNLVFKVAPKLNDIIKVRGNFNLMDDANLPSLLSIPYLGYDGRAWDPIIYDNTRKFILSLDNRWYYNYGQTIIKGIGSGHTAFTNMGGPGLVWPMSLISQGLTTQNDTETLEILNMLLYSTDIELKNTIGLTPASISPYQSIGLIHESVWVQNPNKYTRGGFGWANAYFSEYIQHLIKNKKNANDIFTKINYDKKVFC